MERLINDPTLLVSVFAMVNTVLPDQLDAMYRMRIALAELLVLVGALMSIA